MVVPNGPYFLSTDTDPDAPEHPVGAHGFDATRMPEMKALFVADWT